MSIRDITLTPLQQNVMDADANIVGMGGGFCIGMTTAAHVIAYRKHKKSILFSSDWQRSMGSGRELFGADEATWIGNPRRCWEFNGRSGRLQLGKISGMDDSNKYRGGEWDGMFFDDIEGMLYKEMLNVMAWNRSSNATLQAQTYIMFHPPCSEGSLWIYNMFAPWIEREHPNPARDGEKRWMIFHEGSCIEVETQLPIEFPKIYKQHGSAKIWTNETTTCQPVSITFYKGGYEEIQADEEIQNSVRGLPAPLSQQLLYGDFEIGRNTQEIPEAAQRRHDTRPPGRIGSDTENYQDTSDADDLIAWIQRGVEGNNNE